MKTRYAVISLFILFSVSCWAQTNPFYGFRPLAQVKDFLQLTDVQVTMILMNNNEYNGWSMEKQNRIRQVQSEIAEETAKENLDPNALGIRYAEIEAICRDLKAHATDYQAKNVQVLTDPQRAKLKVLDDARTLQPVIAEAQSGNLLGIANVAPYAFTSLNTGIGTGTIGGIIGGAPGCNQTMPLGGVIRTGDFSGSINRK